MTRKQKKICFMTNVKNLGKGNYCVEEKSSKAVVFKGTDREKG